jgi:CheY-like chemotaxis protein
MNKIVVIMSDLFFSAKINDAAKKFGMGVVVVRDPALALEKAQDGPPMVILDLNCQSARPLDLITKMKGDPSTKDVPVVGFVSHVQVELRQKAEEAGCDLVVPRSVFAQDLAAILERFLPKSEPAASAAV